MIPVETAAQAAANLCEQLSDVFRLVHTEEQRVPTPELLPPERVCDACGAVLYPTRPYRTKTQMMTQWTCGNGHVLTERTLLVR